MDDLAWVSLRSVQEPFGDQRELFAAYEAASGNRIDAGRIRYYRVMAEAKILAMSHNSPPAARAESGRDAGAAVIFGHLHRRLCLEALGDAMGEPIPRFNVPASSQPTDAQLLIDSVLDSLRTDIVPRISDPFASRRAKSSARVLKYVSNLIANQATFEALELEQLNEVLGTPSATVAAARNVLSDAIATAHIRDSPAFRAVAIRVSLDQILTREASGALAERHYQPF